MADDIIGQQVPLDFTSGFSGQWVLGPVRIDIATGDITHDFGNGLLIGFNAESGYSGFSGFSSQSGRSGYSGWSGPSGFSGFSGDSGFSGIGFSGPSGPSGPSGFSGTGFSGPSGPSGFSGFSGLSFGLQMGIGGRLPTAGLPETGLGVEIVPITTMLQYFRGRRSTPGTAGTTTVQLEINGSPVTGASLSWVSSDPAFTLKTATFTPTAIGPGDYVSIRLTAAETNAYDVHTEAN